MQTRKNWGLFWKQLRYIKEWSQQASTKQTFEAFTKKNCTGQNYPFPKGQILDSSKLKDFAALQTTILNLMKMAESSQKGAKNMVGKEKLLIFLFPQHF